jgi:MFS family permease
MPSLVRAATGLTSPFVGGLVVALLTLTATFVVLILRNRPGAQVLSIGTMSLIAGVAVTLGGVWLHFAPVLIAGAVITGIGFGGCFSGAMRTIVPLAAPDERAGLLAAFFVQSYLAFSLPAVLVGLAAPILGLSYAAYVYGAVVIALAAISLIAARLPIFEHQFLLEAAKALEQVLVRLARRFHRWSLDALSLCREKVAHCAAVFRVLPAFDQSVALHAGERIGQRRLFHLQPVEQFTLCQPIFVPEFEQHGKLARQEAERIGAACKRLGKAFRK